MLSEQQEKLLDGIAAAWEKHPEWRFGQLLYNIVGTDEPNSQLYYLDNNKLAAKLHNYRFPPS